MAQELAEALDLNEVRFIPAAIPPHKTAPDVSAEHRAAMVRVAIAGNPIFKFDDRELNRTGASYTVDTLHSLRSELGENVSLVLTMGSDAFTRLNTWHRWQELLQLCHIALVQRPHNNNIPKDKLPGALETLLHEHYTENGDDLHNATGGCITMQHITALDISSTAIRHAFEQKISARYLLPEAVIDYIQQHHLYQHSES